MNTYCFTANSHCSKVVFLENASAVIAAVFYKELKDNMRVPCDVVSQSNLNNLMEQICHLIIILKYN